MKRQLLFVALLIIGFNASAQFTKGEKVLSGNLSFSTNKNSYTNSTSLTQENSNTNFALSTGIGWVKSENRIKGFRVSYYNGVSKYSNTSTKSTINNFTLGVFDQRIKSFNKNFFGFFETNLSGGYSWNKYIDATTSVNGITYRSYGAGANAHIGIGYRVTKHLIADATLSNLLAISYNHTDPEINTSATTSNSKNSNFSISTGLSSLSLNSVAIGFRWVFQ